MILTGENGGLEYWGMMVTGERRGTYGSNDGMILTGENGALGDDGNRGKERHLWEQ